MSANRPCLSYGGAPLDVSPVPGTTMDTVGTEVEHDGHLYRFEDTAGTAGRLKRPWWAETERGDGAARVGALRCRAADRGRRTGRYRGRRAIASYAEVWPQRDHRDEQVGSRHRSARKAAERDRGHDEGKASCRAPGDRGRELAWISARNDRSTGARVQRRLRLAGNLTATRASEKGDGNRCGCVLWGDRGRPRLRANSTEAACSTITNGWFATNSNP